MKKDVAKFIASLENKTKRSDSEVLVNLLRKESGFDPYLSGTIIGFGQYHYKYASGREGDSIVIGFSPRKQNIAIYIMPGFSEFQKKLEKLGKHKTGKCCLYVNKLSDINLTVLRSIINRAVKIMVKKYSCKNA